MSIARPLLTPTVAHSLKDFTVPLKGEAVFSVDALGLSANQPWIVLTQGVLRCRMAGESEIIGIDQVEPLNRDSADSFVDSRRFQIAFPNGSL